MEQIISSLVPVIKIVVSAPPTAQVTAVAIVAIVAVVAVVSMLRGGAGPK